MSNIPNHYETLNVAVDASQEQIKASYLKLYKLFHPDLNPDMQEGMLMISELNKAYEVLKDPATRQNYDLQFITAMKRKLNRQAPVAPVVESIPEIPALPSLPEIPRRETPVSMPRAAYVPEKPSNNMLKIAAISAIAIMGALFSQMSAPSKTSSRLGMIDLQEVIGASKYVRPVTAPNGVAFPESTAYITGYDVKNNDGTSSLMIDNMKNDHDVYLKLISLQDNKALTVRHVFIKAKTDFKMENLTSGKYEVQYLDLVAGLVGKSETFEAQEIQSALGTKSSSKSITLQTAVNGVLRVETVSIDDFNSLASL